MECTNMSINPSMFGAPDYSTEIERRIKELRAEFPQFSKKFKLLNKQHDIMEVAYSGKGWFTNEGEYTYTYGEDSFKFKIGYRNRINRETHLMVFN